MPKGVRKEYSKEFKLSVVFLMKSGTLPKKKIYEMFGNLDRQTAYRWVHEYDEKGESAFDPKNAVLPGPQLRQLQKDLEDARMENDLLKKAVTYFAKKNMKE